MCMVWLGWWRRQHNADAASLSLSLPAIHMFWPHRTLGKRREKKIYPYFDVRSSTLQPYYRHEERHKSFLFRSLWVSWMNELFGTTGQQKGIDILKCIELSGIHRSSENQNWKRRKRFRVTYFVAIGFTRAASQRPLLFLSSKVSEVSKATGGGGDTFTSFCIEDWCFRFCFSILCCPSFILVLCSFGDVWVWVPERDVNLSCFIIVLIHRSAPCADSQLLWNRRPSFFIFNDPPPCPLLLSCVVSKPGVRTHKWHWHLLMARHCLIQWGGPKINCLCMTASRNISTPCLWQTSLLEKVEVLIIYRDMRQKDILRKSHWMRIKIALWGANFIS